MPESVSNPAAGGRVRRIRDERLNLRMEVAELLAVEPEGVQELTVHVELHLGPRAVADPSRARVAPATQVPKLALGQVVLAADPVHDLERTLAGAPAGRAGHERDELLRLVRACSDVRAPRS
jgi:hypothetical protein